MHSLLLSIATLPLAFANVNLFARDTILTRQGSDAFKPSTDGITDNCAPEDICGGGDDSPVVCLVRSLGDTCCPENYGCPGGNFCLIKGFCCPDGDDPTTCATRNGITLPPNFQPGQQASTSPSTSSSPAPSALSSSATSTISTKPSTFFSSSSSTTASAPSTPISQHPVVPSSSNNNNNNATVIAAQPKPSATGPAAVAFTGGANVLRGSVGNVVLAVAGGFAAIFHL